MARPVVKSLVISIIILAAAVAAIYVYANIPPHLPVSFTVNGQTHDFTAVAANISEDEKGLMNATVTNSTFMLFIFNSPYRWGFWMKNTYDPLDMIWVDGGNSGGRIVFIEQDAVPCISYSPMQTNCTIYTPNSPANYVIEAKAGFAKSENITLGSNVTFNYRN